MVSLKYIILVLIIFKCKVYKIYNIIVCICKIMYIAVAPMNIFGYKITN